jgi:uncharacterized protein with von Willebrand factor type A (vWA) domain
MAEQVMRRTARQREYRLDALPDTLAGRISGLRDYEFLGRPARDAFNELTDELRQQMLQTYFQGLKEGVQGVTPGGPGGIRDMVRDLNALLEKHATGADTTDDFAASWRSTGTYFPPGISSTDELIEHLHRQASQMASLLNSLSPQMRDELRELMDDLLRDDRLRIDMARLAGNLQAARPDLPFGEPYPFEGDEPMGLATRWPPSTASRSTTPWRRRWRGPRSRRARARSTPMRCATSPATTRSTTSTSSAS